jgi:trimeric autotransporter adhesin
MSATYLRKLAFLILFITGITHSGVFSQTISGHLVVCRGASRTTLSIDTSGGVWSSGDVTKATIDAGTGEVTGVAAGTATISYTIAPSSVFTAVVTVNGYVMNPIGFSMGNANRCTGSLPAICTVSPMIGNAWTSSDPSVATVSASGQVTPSASTAGTTIISYRHGYGNCYVTTGVTVSATPTITATTPVCNLITQTLTATPAGGTWMSTNPSVGTIHSTTGVFTSLTGGYTRAFYTAPNGCKYSAYMLVAATPVAILGTPSVCMGNARSLYCASTGGTWSSSNTSVATISPTTGVVTPVSTGTSTISYTNGGGCASTVVLTVYPAVSPIVGPNTVCLGQMMTLTNASGGYWTSSAPSRATITTYGGVVSGIATGTVTIHFVAGSGCSTSKIVTVNPVPVAISGPAYLCMSDTATLTHPDAGGTWASSNGNATIDISSGSVAGITAGSSTITYTISPGCVKTHFLIIRSTPGATTALSPLCPGSNTTFINATSGGTWSSSDPSVMTIVSGTGVATSVAAGTTTLSYVLTATGCSTSSVFTVNSLPAAITGPLNVCPGSAISLSSATSGGTWTSSNTGVATIGASTGYVSAILAGTATMSYTVSSGCRRTSVVTVDPIPAVITGTMSVCELDTTVLASTSAGGSWSSSDPSIAMVTSTGAVVGVSPGSATITYTLPTSCLRTTTVTVNPLPRAGNISGAGTLCLGSTLSLTDTVAGGIWSSSNTSVATVSSSGVVSPVSLGTATISYGVTNGCGTAYATAVIPVDSMPVMPTITGGSSVCAGSTLGLSASAAGGSWNSSLPSVASVTSTGLVSGGSAGSAVISYTVTNACGSATATHNIVVLPLPDAGAISGPAFVCAGSSISLSSSVGGGVWSSGDLAVATVDSTGTLSGIAPGTVAISYSFTNSCGTAYATVNVTVGALAYVSAITGPSLVCAGSDITLSDSVSGGTWSSEDTSIATVSSTGLVHGLAAGSVTISYNVSTACSSETATKLIFVSPLPSAFSVTGSGNYCYTGSGANIILSGSQAGANYQLYLGASPFGIPLAGTGGAISFGSFTLSGTYTVLGVDTISGCASGMAGSAVVTMVAAPSAGTISGPSTVAPSSSITLSSTVTGGSWSSSNAAIATVGVGTGIVTGVSGGSVIISYTVANSCDTAVATYAVFVGSSKPGVAPNSTIGLALVYPNPTAGDITIRSVAGGVAILATIDGKEIYRYTLSAGETSLQMPESLPGGIYMVRVEETDGHREVVRLDYRP